MTVSPLSTTYLLMWVSYIGDILDGKGITIRRKMKNNIL